MSGTKHQFQIYLPGLLKVLAENLYSTKKVAIRELLQNAHDSCVRRTVESGEDSDYQPRVYVTADPEQQIIRIIDNGSGLTSEEVTEYLATIGRSYTRDLGERLSILSPEEAERLIGQFGLGFLSAFLIATEVRLITKSMQPDAEAVEWTSSGDIHYETKPGQRDEVGTTVELHVKASASFLVNEQILVETVQQYADFLSIPIYVGDQTWASNMMTPPWQAPSPEEAVRAYLGRTFNISDPLVVIRLSDYEIDLGHDKMTIPMEGFLFVPPRSVASVREYGDLSVFIRRMFICKQQRDLLPAWARFVRGVIDCPYLQPTASREELQQDETFFLVRQALEAQLIAALRMIAQNDQPLWRRIVWGHSDVIIGWAVTETDFFDQVADLVLLRTTRGSLNLPDYLSMTDSTIYYVTRELGSLQEQLLGEGRDMPVIDASWFSVEPFLAKYAAMKGGIKLVQLEGDSQKLLRPVDEEPYSALTGFYRANDIRVSMVEFKPDEVPALIFYPKDAEFYIETKNALDSGTFPAPLAGLIGDYMKRKNVNDDLRGTLYLNAGCPLIQQLKADGLAEPTRQAVLKLLYQMARLFSGRTMSPSDARSAFSQAVDAMKGLIG